MTTAAATKHGEPDLSVVVTQLMKGVLYRDVHESQWNQLVQLQAKARDYVGVIGLTVVVDEAEGYAFLRSRPDLDDDDGPAIPRLIPRRALSFHVSLLLALLRKKLIEFDASGGVTKLVLTREQIVEMVRVFLPEGSNEVRLVDQIDSYIGKIVDLGFLRRIKDADGHYEVRRVIKAFVDGQWLAEFDRRLGEYAAQLRGEDYEET